MKARIKATGEIVEVGIDYNQDADFIAPNGLLYWQEELDFTNVNTKIMREETMIEAINDIDSIRCMVEDIHEEMTNTPDYWTRLEHTYAGMAMQGILACEEWKIAPREGVSFAGEVALQAHELAHALVEKYKKEGK